MNFHEVRFPSALTFGSLGGPERRTDVVQLANGYEERNSPWAHSRRRYDAGLGVRSMDDIEDLIAFFEARQGQMFGFRWKDWSDCKSCLSSQQPTPTDQPLGTGDGVETVFALTKTYHSGAFEYVRPITKPVAGSVRIALKGIELSEGADFTVDDTTGLVTLAEVAAVGVVLTAGFEFDVPVRFDTDSIQSSAASFRAGELPNVPIVEVRV